MHTVFPSSSFLQSGVAVVWQLKHSATRGTSNWKVENEVGVFFLSFKPQVETRIEVGGLEGGDGKSKCKNKIANRNIRRIK